jgi:hypothetical protein
MTTGLVRLPEGTDMIAACTLVNWPLPSVATTRLIGLTADWLGATDWPPEFKARMANAHNAVDSAVGIEQMIRFMSGWNSFQLPRARWIFNPTTRREPET